MSWVTTTSALAKTASVSSLSARLPVEDVVVGLAFLVVADDGRVGVERVRGVDDRGQRLVVDVDELERVACRVAVLGDDEGDLLALEAHLVGGEDGDACRSTASAIHARPSVSSTAPVMTAFTFGCASAAEVSMLLMRACASGLRRTAPCSMPGRTMSST